MMEVSQEEIVIQGVQISLSRDEALDLLEELREANPWKCNNPSSSPCPQMDALIEELELILNSYSK